MRKSSHLSTTLYSRSLMKCLLLAFLSIACLHTAYAYPGDPPTGRSGAPGESTCNASGCHSTFALNSGGGTLTINNLPAKYTPGQTYDLLVTIAQSGAKRWGFEISSRKEGTTARGGTFALSDTTLTRFAANPSSPKLQYITQTSKGTRNNVQNGPVDFPVKWTAPAAGSGPVRFYVAGNAANGNGNETGDHIYTAQARLEEFVAPTVLPGDVNADGTVNIADAILSLQFSVGILTPTDAQKTAADVNGDGKINIQDATDILRLAVGIVI